jgi:Fur family ferric uptake transcriptional regulator
MLKSKKLTINHKDILKDNGFKNTPTRLAILDVFNKNHKPISADFIYKKLKGGINEATVYRTLSSFEKSGILKKVDLRSDSICFELNDDHHHHMVCIKCGAIEDFKESKEVEKLLGQIVEKSIKFKKIKEHSLELFGYCKACN